MRRLILSLAILAAFYNNLPGQINEKQLLELMAKDDVATARQKVEEAVKRYPHSPVALYFQALLEVDAVRALELYKSLVKRFRSSEYAVKSLYRIGQFYFARGFYYSARKYFLDVIRTEPNSDLADKATYFAAKCLFAAGKRDSARQEFIQLKRHHPPQLLIALIDEDLATLNSSGPDRYAAPAAQTPGINDAQTGGYTVQIGSYLREENARSQKKYFALLGYPVEIKEIKKNSATYYRVFIGRFSEKAKAKKFAQAFKQKFGLKTHIVELK
ncbi:MAG: hypothetical protein D6814_04545 [Calditrichaeota bacterium]|nr:MAG: hypothetical protein D6814_04545 [Calditrichota bacterium]